MANQGKSSSFGIHKNYGQYGGYVPAHKAVLEGARKVAAMNSGVNRNDFDSMLRNNTNAKIKHEVDNVETGFEYGVVPPKYRDQVKEYVMDIAKQQAEIGIKMQNVAPDDPYYLELKAEKDRLKAIIGKGGTLSGDWDKFKEANGGFTEDIYNKNASSVNDPNDVNALAEIFTYQKDLQINESGHISFGDDELGYSTMEELPDYFNKDYKNGSATLKLLEKAYENGVELNDNNILTYQNDFHEMLNKGGRETMFSLAFDNLWTPNETLLNKDEYRNVIAAINGDDPIAAMKAEKILKRRLVEAYTDKIKSQASAGYIAANEASGETHPDKWKAFETDLKGNADNPFGDPFFTESEPEIYPHKGGEYNAMDPSLDGLTGDEKAAQIKKLKAQDKPYQEQRFHQFTYTSGTKMYMLVQRGKKFLKLVKETGRSGWNETGISIPTDGKFLNDWMIQHFKKPK